MFEFNFSITEVLDTLEGKSIKEKLEELDSLYAELSDAADEVSDAREDIEEEYEERIQQSLEHSITQLSAEQHLEDVLHIKGDHSYDVMFDGHTYHFLFIENMGEWYLLVYINEPINQKRNELLENFANFCGLPFTKWGVEINLLVEESELFEQIKSILLKIKG